MRSRWAAIVIFSAFAFSWQMTPAAQLPQSSTVEVRPIDPAGVSLPSETATASVTRFSFIAYGDTRGPADGTIVQPAHRDVINRMLETLPIEQAAGFPVRFVVQSGDAVVNGRFGEQFNVSFSPLIERLLHEGRVPYVFAVGNHDVGTMPIGSPERTIGLRNTSAAMSALWPPEGSERRLTGYPTFGFGFGRFFFIALDSNVASDETQLAWVTSQLEHLDRRRYSQIVALFHHPPLTTGPHGGPLVEHQSLAIRQLYMPLFRKHHVRMTIAGHDHLFDHFVERYEDEHGTHRMDHIVTGGGGAPIYTYRGEQDLDEYVAEAAPDRVRVEHLVKPGLEAADNPHHFVILDVDGDRIWLRPVATVAAPFLPHGTERIELTDDGK